MTGLRYRLFFEISPTRGKWKAVLIVVQPEGEPVPLIRLEDQPGTHGGGLQVHANCDQNQHLVGAEAMDMAYVLPEHGRLRRRRLGWTGALFCQAAGRMFRTDLIEGQEEWAL